MWKRLWLIGLIVVFCSLAVSVAMAQEAAQEAAQDDASAETDPDEPIIHTVISGDTLFSIAVQYDTTVENLLLLNNLSENAVLQLGQEIIVSGKLSLPPGARIVEDEALLYLPDFPPVPKIHLVADGETATSIAELYGITVEQLLTENGLSAETILQLDQSLVIPNIIGDLIATDYTVQFGDTLAGIAEKFNTDPNLLLQPEFALINPEHLVVGQQLPIIGRSGSVAPVQFTATPHIVQPDETLTTIAANYTLTPIELATANNLPYPATLVAGQQLRIPTDTPYQPLTGLWQTVTVDHTPLRQGEAFSIYAINESISSDQLTGRITRADTATPTFPYQYTNYIQTFPFAPFENGHLAIVGLDSFVPSGLYTLELLENEQMTLQQTIFVADGNYGTQQITISEQLAILLAPEVRANEDAFLAPIYEQFNLEPTWAITQPFRYPLDQSYLTARYGDARSYNGGPYQIFHTGVDFAAPVSTPVVAAASGEVVFSDLTDLRGNLVIIDHGLGVMTAYFHLTQRLVAVGDVVAAGEAIGGLGATGLVSGAHLHWDVRIRNVPVNGLQWLRESFPFTTQ